jgi:hypothetical protein
VPASTRGVADICANGSPAPPDRGASSDSNRTRPMNLYVEIGRPNFDAISQLVQQQWKAVGVPINLMPLDRQVMQDLVYVKRGQARFRREPERIEFEWRPRNRHCAAVHLLDHRPHTADQRRRVLQPGWRQAVRGGGRPERSQAARSVVPAGRQTPRGRYADAAVDRSAGPLGCEYRFQLKTTFWDEGLIYDRMSNVYLKA